MGVNMQLTRIILCAALMGCFAHDGKAQPGTCWAAPGAAGTSASCPATGSPTIQAYVSAYNTFLNATWPGIQALSQPKIANDLELVGASANWIENCPTTGTCLYNSAAVQEAFVANVLKKSGATGVIWNIDYMPYMLSTGYTWQMLAALPSVPTRTGYGWLQASKWGRRTRQGKTKRTGRSAY